MGKRTEQLILEEFNEKHAQYEALGQIVEEKLHKKPGKYT